MVKEGPYFLKDYAPTNSMNVNYWWAKSFFFVMKKMRVSFIILVINENETCVGKSKNWRNFFFFFLRVHLRERSTSFLGMLVFVRSIDFVLFISANNREDKWSIFPRLSVLFATWNLCEFYFLSTLLVENYNSIINSARERASWDLLLVLITWIRKQISPLFCQNKDEGCRVLS